MRTRRWVGTMAGAAAVVALSATPASAQAGRAQVREGNRLYEAGRFDEAHAKYLEALRENPESPLIRFNAGNASYQSQDLQQAVEAYQQAVASGDPSLASAAWYNLGNALYRSQQLENSLEAYKQALRMNPDDPDAKYNLERVLEKMQEQQNQDQQNQEQQNQEQQNQDQQNQDQQNQDQQNQDQQNQDQQNPDQQGEQPQPDQQDPQEGQGEPRPQDGRMTPQEAQRLLDAIDEDPGDVNRKPAAVRGRKPRKVW
jgi:Ca-activated chloride channel homolog